MIYKLIILVASIFMIYEFTKSRSTAVAQIEPLITGKQYGWSNLPVGHTCNNSVIGFTGERVCLDKGYVPDLSAYRQLNGV
jgi:hypothetical protein